MYKEQLNNSGYSTTPILFTNSEIENITTLITNWQKDNIDNNNQQVFSIRRLIQKIPQLQDSLFNEPLLKLIKELGDEKTFLVKAIYFDKPEGFNWFVSYHQDISITVNEKHNIDGYSKWTAKHNQIGVVPPEKILDSIFTIRVHLDKTDSTNGALRIIPKSHLNGIQNIKDLEHLKQTEILCNVEKGQTMLMKPLTFHASSKSEMTNRRRVIHLEFSSKELELPLKWAEKLKIKHIT